MSSFPIEINQEDIDHMKMAASAIINVANTYLVSFTEPKKSLLGKIQVSQEQAATLKSAADLFLRESQDENKDARLTYFFFIKDTIETLNTIPRNDKLRLFLEKGALSQFHASLNKLMQYKAAYTSQEYMGIYVTLIKDRFRISEHEERGRPSDRSLKAAS